MPGGVGVRHVYTHTHMHTHLEGYVGYCLAHLDEPLPRAFAQEAERHVEGRATPVLEGVAAVQRVRAVWRGDEQVSSK